MSQTPATTRPGGVTTVIVLTIISGVFAIIIGVVAILGRNNVTVEGSGQQSTSGALLAIGVVGIILGLIYLAVARGLAHGNNGSRILVIIVAALQLISAAYSFFAGGNKGSDLLSIIIPALIIIFLNTAAAKAFFARR